MAEESHQDRQRAQLSELVDHCMQRVMQDAKADLSKLEALASQWSDFELAFLERNREKRAELVASLSIYERHSGLRPKVLEALKGWLAADPHYQTLTEPLRQIQKLEDRVLELEAERRLLSKRNLALNVRLLRIDVTEGKVPTDEERRRIARKRDRAPSGTKAIQYWRGADVTVLEKLDSNYQPRSGDTVVTTRHAGVLGSIFDRLADASKGALHYLNKYEFYGRTGEAVNRLLERNSDAAETDVLLAALDGASEVLTCWDNRRKD